MIARGERLEVVADPSAAAPVNTVRRSTYVVNPVRTPLLLARAQSSAAGASLCSASRYSTGWFSAQILCGLSPRTDDYVAHRSSRDDNIPPAGATVRKGASQGFADRRRSSEQVLTLTEQRRQGVFARASCNASIRRSISAGSLMNGGASWMVSPPYRT